MARLERPKNDWAKALFILHHSYMGGTNMLKVLTDHDRSFWKFQTRLSDILSLHPKLKISKVAIPFKNKLTGKTGYYTQYTPLCPPKYLLNLYNKINREGLKRTE